MPSTPAPARGLDPIALAAALHPLARDIAAGRLITASALERGLERVFGRPASTGAWDWRTAYDVLEAASALALVASGDRDLAALIADEAHRPTQTRRSEAQIRLQQFSTPLPYASVAAEAAALNAGDLVLEPSAGCGALAACAKRAGATLLLNEIDPRRRALLGIVFGQSVSGHDGATLDDVLARHVLPAVVLMNPPFSSSFDRADDSTVAARHLTSALKRLAPGGRLVAIMPTGFGPERQPRHWAALTRSAQVHVAITVPGSVYRKNGTAVETQLIVADKGPEPGDGKCRFAHVSDLAGGEAEPLRIVRKVLAATLPPRLAITHITPPVPALRPAPRPTPAARRPVPQAALPAAPSVAPLDYAVRSHPRVNEALSD